MSPRSLPPLPSRQPWRQSDLVDKENHQEQIQHPLLSRAGVNLKRGIRRVKNSIDGKTIEDNEYRETRILDDKDIEEARIVERAGIEEIRSLEDMMYATHHPKGINWREEYEKTAKEVKHLQDEFNQLKHEQYVRHQEIRERALTFEQQFGDPVHSLLLPEDDLRIAIQTLLNNYELRVKEVVSSRHRCQFEPKRYIEKDGALEAKDGQFQMQWDDKDTTLRAQLLQERANAYIEGAADERSSWTVLWHKNQSEHQDELYRQSLRLEKEQTERRTLETRIEFLETKVATSQSELNVAIHKVTKEHDRTLEALATLKKNQKDTNASLVSELSIVEEKHRSQIEVNLMNLKIDCISKIKMMEDAHQIIGAESSCDTALKSRESAYSRDISKLEAYVNSLEENHAIEMKTMSIEYLTELNALHRDIAEGKMSFNVELESLQMNHYARLKSQDNTYAAATSRLKKQFREHLAQQEKEHADATKALRITIHDYSSALLERDKITYNMLQGETFEPLLDDEIEARFAALAEEVDTLSRLDWKANPSGWSEPVLSRLSRNQKTLKRHILKDTIWVILHEFVFCSPFRVFGDEGRALEVKWNEECGADDFFDNGSYIWPRAVMKTERWRYITIRECRAALQKPNPSPYDPLAKLRREFQASNKAMKEKLTTAIGGLVALNQTIVQDLEKMAMRAARTWLEFGLQRYRVMVQMQGDKITSVKEKVERLDKGLALVVAPRLERFGNAKGEELDEKEVIGELDGEIVTLKL